MKLPKDAPRLRKSLNELARKLYADIGYAAVDGHDFQNSRHPQERAMFAAACIAYEHLCPRQAGVLWRMQLDDWKGAP